LPEAEEKMERKKTNTRGGREREKWKFKFYVRERIAP